ncbi:hypothetical protein Hypma_011262 [Hypsizygus marmoreus]|uniref:Secreted protein n=1 Tax=Hypsizygus marmoreus TaxID=39966 RepID=A0A369JM14_HYPMA|nr:hypothetical protein Hypma_011262 [Hypsizygus marmoreus]
MTVVILFFLPSISSLLSLRLSTFCINFPKYFEGVRTRNQLTSAPYRTRTYSAYDARTSCFLSIEGYMVATGVVPGTRCSLEDGFICAGHLSGNLGRRTSVVASALQPPVYDERWARAVLVYRNSM